MIKVESEYHVRRAILQLKKDQERKEEEESERLRLGNKAQMEEQKDINNENEQFTLYRIQENASIMAKFVFGGGKKPKNINRI
jgi:hypothetical protein